MILLFFDLENKAQQIKNDFTADQQSSRNLLNPTPNKAFMDYHTTVICL
jgi:hypothetical protein